MTEEGETIHPPKEIAFSGKPMTFDQLLDAQQELRENNRPTIPFIPDKFAPNYPAVVELQTKLRNKKLEANHNQALGGISIFIDSEDDFDHLHEFLQEQEDEYEVELPKFKR